MSSITKRPVAETSEAPSKRQKTALPSDFFDNSSSEKPIQQNTANEEDEEWERFQAELAGEGSAPEKASTTTEDKSKRRLEILGLNGSSTISADAALANSESAGDPHKDETSSTAAKNSETASALQKKIDKDSYVEEDAAEGLLDQLEAQDELYERVERMKELRRLKQNQKTTETKTSDSKSTLEITDQNMEEDSESDDDNEEEEDEVWRRRGL